LHAETSHDEAQNGRSSIAQVGRETPRQLGEGTPVEIARGLRRSALRSRRTKGTKFQSAMSMLNLYVKRAGSSLSSRDRRRLQRAKVELRRVFGRAA